VFGSWHCSISTFSDGCSPYCSMRWRGSTDTGRCPWQINHNGSLAAMFTNSVYLSLGVQATQ
jgi:hypothetical protein